MVRPAHLLSVIGALGALALSLTPAFAQAPPAPWPSQAIRMVVPVSAGSSTDILIRAIGDRLARVWQQPFIVENRPGLAGTSNVAKSPPDGYSLIIASNGHTAIGSLNKSLSFDPLKDFVGVAQVAVVPMLMVAPPNFPATNLKEFIEIARAKPGELNIAAAGPGTSSNIVAELFKHASGIKAASIQFRGAPEAHLSVMRGDSHAYFTSLPQALEYIRTGKERAIALSSEKRFHALPEVPTIAESGVPGFTQGAWYGILGPAGIPKPLLDRINRDVAAVVMSAEMQTNYEKEGIEPIAISPEAFDKMFRDDTARVSRIFEEMGIAAK